MPTPIRVDDQLFVTCAVRARIEKIRFIHPDTLLLIHAPRNAAHDEQCP